MGKREGRRKLGRAKRRWKDNIKMDLKKVECGVWKISSWFRIGRGGGNL